MKIIDFILLIRKHIVLLIVVPLLLAALVIRLTDKPDFSYTSQTVLYTGLATGSTIEMDKTFNYFLTNTAFDNLLNIINSRETQEEVAIRLLSQHLLLVKADPKYISAKSLADLKKITPAYIYANVCNTKDSSRQTKRIDTLNGRNSDFPSSINYAAYEQTVKSLTRLMNSSDTNFVYELLNYDEPHYSIKAISSAIKAQRIANSDLIKLSYEVDDPGICQQTLAIYNDVCIKNYKKIKENRSDEVVKYFELQLRLANQQLKKAEDKLLVFNKSNNIINYYEQSKAVAVVKEDMEVDYNNKKAQLAGLEAAIKRLEEKLNIQQLVQIKSSSILEKRRNLGRINYDIATAEADTQSLNPAISIVPALKKEAELVINEIRKSVDELYSYQHTTDGLPIDKVLTDWLNNIVEAENLRAKLAVMDQRNKEFQQQYSIYAPAGANIKRIEREISVSEQGYLEILHGLNLAKLKLQDNELSADLKAIDPPYYPITSIPTKRKVLVIAAALIGVILVLGVILVMEYLDDTLKNTKKASRIFNLPSLGMIPKIYLKPGISDFISVQKRLVEIITQNIKHRLNSSPGSTETKTIVFASSMNKEGKTILAGNIARKLIEEGKKVLVLNYSGEIRPLQTKKRISFLHLLLGYKDQRINYSSSFLEEPSAYLANAEYSFYRQNEAFYNAKSYEEILGHNNTRIDFIPDYVLIELPPLLNNNYPPLLVTNADLTVLVCRSNRIWSQADQTALNGLLPLTDSKIAFILNGVEIGEVEALLGELPKKRSVIRKKLKSFLRFQFFTKTDF